MNSRRIWQATGVMALACLVLSACAPIPAATPAAQAPATAAATEAPQVTEAAPEQAAEQTTLTVWMHTNASREKKVAEMVKLFESENPDIKVDVQVFPYNDMWEKLLPSIAAGTGPDLIHSHGSWTTLFVQNNAWLPVPETVLSKAEIEKMFYPWALVSFKRAEQYYGLPYAVGSEAVYLNDALFEEAGLDPTQCFETWDDLLTAAQKMTKTDSSGKIVQTGFSLKGSHIYIDTIFFQHGTDVVDNTKTPPVAAFDNPNGVAAYQWMADVFTKWKVDSYDFPDPLAEFPNNKVAMSIFGSWAGEIWLTDKPDFKFHTCPEPVIKKGDSPVIGTVGGGWGWTVSATTKKTDQAWRLFKFFTAPEQQQYMVFVEGNPVTSYVMDNAKTQEILDKSPWYKPFIANVPAYKYVGDKVNEHEFNLALERGRDRMVLEGADAETAMKTAAEEINVVLQGGTQ